MKKLIITFALTLAVTGAAFAQGSVNWSIAFSAMTSQTNGNVASTFGSAGAPSGTTQGSTAQGNLPTGK